MQLSEENKREIKFHDDLQGNDKVRFENRFYKALANMFSDFDSQIEQNCKNKRILDFGCGIGNNLEKVLKFSPKEITGVDISKVSLEKAKRIIGDDKSKNINFIHDNCEKLSFVSGSFEVVYGSGILHHLKYDLALKEISRVLTNSGKIIFVEPLGTNPVINFYRRLTPKSRSIDEHPFLENDFSYFRAHFKDIKLKYYGFLTLIFIFFYKDPKNSLIFNFLSNLDQKLFKYKFFQKFAWSVLITGAKN